MYWPTKKLGEVCKLQNGFAFKSSEYISSGLFVMRIANVQDGYISLEDPQFIDEKRKDEFKTFLLKEGDILISLTGNIGRVGVINPDHLPAVLNQRVGRIVPTDKTDRDYLFYFLRSPKFFEEITKSGHGMAQQNISTKDIANLEISLPPLAEQKRIVKKIEELFGKIDQALLARKEAMEDAARIMQKALDEVFEGAEKNGWEIKEFSDINILKMTSGGTPSRGNKFFYEGDIPWLKSGELNDNINIIGSEEHITEQALQKSSAKVFPKNTVLFAMYGATAGKLGILVPVHNLF